LEEEILEKKEALEAISGKPVEVISAVQKDGVKEVLRKIFQIIKPEQDNLW
jgi:Fe2+ transport system protein B